MIKKFAIILTLGAICSACDTVAELTFQEELPVEMAAQGLISSACGAKEGSDAVLRFSILTSFDQHLMPGRRYASNGDVLDPGRNFKETDISFSPGWFFVVSTGGSDMTCTSAADCPDGASCLSASEMNLSSYYYPPSKFCVYPTQIDAVSVPRFEHFRENMLSDNANVKSGRADGRSIGFILDNSASLDGSAKTGIPNSAEATDPWDYRKVGLNLFMDGLALTEEVSPKYEFSAHFANGSGKNGVYEASENWLRTIAQWNSKVMSQYPTPSGQSPIWETAGASLEKMTGTSNSTYSHILVAMTDGAPNLSTEDYYQKFVTGMKSTGRLALHWLELESEAPHSEYAEVVKLGCGTHYLFDNPVFYSKIMRNIAINTESHWDVDVRFSAELAEGYSYRLATIFVATIGNTAVTYEAQRVNEEAETLDYRWIFTR